MKERPRICLIEDDELMGESLCDRFELEGFAHDWYRNGTSALEEIGNDHGYVAVISDIRLPDMDGEDIFRKAILRGGTLPPWIFITGHGSIDRAVSLLKMGATDYIAKPFDLDALIVRINEIATTLTPPADSQVQPRLGISQPMHRIEELLPRLAAQADTLLITGESGVGKEVVASLIHDLDPETAARPFIAVNCASLPESLIEAELFGYEKGAFTGAARTKPGVFEQAEGGTLFLDEIGDMPLLMQSKLLRVIQERKVVRVGGEQPFPVNLRLICATHRDLKAMVETGEMREDLFYRIHVIHLRIPPLRERREDIIWFARQFLDDYARRYPGEERKLSPPAERLLEAHDWPGNIRELKHAIERACILSQGPHIETTWLFDDDDHDRREAPEGGQLSLGEYLHTCERAFIVRTLEEQDGHLGNTAATLGISRKNLWEKMKKLGL